MSLSYSRYQADEYYSGPGELDSLSNPLPRGTRQGIKIPVPGGFGTVNQDSNYVDQAMLLYGEVSLSYGLGAVVSMPLLRYVSQDLGQVMGTETKLTSLGVGDLVAGLKYQIPTFKKAPGFAWGPQVYFTAPTGDKNGRGAYPSSFNLSPLPMPTGNGTGDIEARGSFGYSFYPIPVFMAADVGYHHHFNTARCQDSKGNDADVKFSDDLIWSFQVGATWAPKKKYFDHGTLIATVHGVKSFENGDVPGQDGIPNKGSPYLQPCGQANNMSYLAFGGTLMLFPIKWVGVTYTIEHTLWGVNTGYGLTNIVGVATEF